MAGGDRGVVLLAHGSADPAWKEAVAAVCRRVEDVHAVPCAVAVLHPSGPSLDEAVSTLEARGCRTLEVVAWFLAAGRHVTRDLPDLVRAVAARRPHASITLRPGALGEDPRVLDALATAAVRGPHPAAAPDPAPRRDTASHAGPTAGRTAPTTPAPPEDPASD